MKRQQGTAHISIHARLMCVDESAMVHGQNMSYSTYLFTYFAIIRTH